MSDPLPTLFPAPFLLGEQARLSIVAAGDDGAPIDPVTLRLRVIDPAGVAASYTYGVDAQIVRDALGTYRADLALGKPGLWYWRWESAQPSVGVAEGRIDVLRSRFALESAP